MEAHLQTLKTFTDTLNGTWLSDVRRVRDKLASAETSADTFGGGPWAGDLSSAWNGALDSRRNETETVENELAFFHNLLNEVAIDFEITDDDNSESLYEHG